MSQPGLAETSGRDVPGPLGHTVEDGVQMETRREGSKEGAGSNQQRLVGLDDF